MNDKTWTGKRIKALREKYKITQLTLAKMVGTRGQQTITDWERGLSEPQLPYPRLLDNVEEELALLWVEAREDRERFYALIERRYRVSSEGYNASKGRPRKRSA